MPNEGWRLSHGGTVVSVVEGVVAPGAWGVGEDTDTGMNLVGVGWRPKGEVLVDPNGEEDWD